VTYLYGEECLGEFRDGAPLYYLHDGDRYVRQGTDTRGEVVSIWRFDPDGTVLEGPEGPVSHLVCGGVYDWSTGLIYRDGRYFDPALGIWLALVPLMVVQGGRKRKSRRQWALLLGVALLAVGTLVGCGGGETPTPTPTLCIPTGTPSPSPSPTPSPTPDPPTPIPTDRGQANQHGYFHVDMTTAIGGYYNTEQDFRDGEPPERWIQVRVGQNTPNGRMFIDDWTTPENVGWNLGVHVAKLKWVATEEWVGSGGLSEITVHGIGRRGDPTDTTEPWPDCPYGSEWACKYDGMGCIGVSNVNDHYIHEKWFDWWLNNKPRLPDRYVIVVEVVGQRPPRPTPTPSL
jgi:hypothetical protein